MEETRARCAPKSPKRYGEEAIAELEWELWDAPDEEQVIYHSFPEFTCLCPRSGYPDFATLHMVEVPDEKVLELKVLKLWLNSFRERYISHEKATEELFNTFWNKVCPKALFVAMEYTPRGNLKTYPAMMKVKTLGTDARYLFREIVRQVWATMVAG